MVVQRVLFCLETYLRLRPFNPNHTHLHHISGDFSFTLGVKQELFVSRKNPDDYDDDNNKDGAEFIETNY